MIRLLRAELLKAVKHYRLISFLVWVFPVGAASFYLLGLPMTMLSPAAKQSVLASCPGNWIVDATGPWSVLTSFPGSVFGKLLPLGFMAVMFAGEYEWRTWKNLVPRTRRHRLMLAKMLALVAIVASSFVVLSLIPPIGQNLGCKLLGGEPGPPVTAGMLGEFGRRYGQAALLGLISLFIMAALAALGALLTRSILGALLVSFGLSLLDPLMIGVLSIAGGLLNLPRLKELYLFTASYNLDNLRTWFQTGRPLAGLTQDSQMFSTVHSVSGSLMILAVWVIGLAALSIWLFRRQDITS